MATEPGPGVPASRPRVLNLLGLPTWARPHGGLFRVARPRRPTRPSMVDLALMAGFVLLSLSEILFNDSVRSALHHAVLASLPLVALAWRRQYPIFVALVVLASNLVANPNHEFTTVLTLVLCSYTVGVETAPPRSYVGLAVTLGPFLIAMFVDNGALLPSDVAAAAVLMVGPWLVGYTTRIRTEKAVRAVTEAERRLHEQEIRAHEAASNERNRIARELHDIVSHAISVVTIQTQAVRRRLGPENAQEAADLAMVETTAREAQAEMRRLFGVLRADGESAAMAPQPGLSELPRLVDSVSRAGTEIMLQAHGDPVPLSPGLDLTAYRIAQEGLTNALRHSGAHRIDVIVRHQPKALEVEVHDDGQGMHPGETSGHGLVGIRERIALYGGTLDVDEHPSGGVRLRARLPLAESG